MEKIFYEELCQKYLKGEKNGIIPSHPDNKQEFDYYKVQAMSASAIKKLLDDPKRYEYFENNPSPKTEALLFGNVLHTLVLEPHKIHLEYMRQNFDGRSAEGKQEKKEAEEKNLLLIKPALWDKAANMAEVIRNHPVGNFLFPKVNTEEYKNLQIEREVEYYTQIEVINKKSGIVHTLPIKGKLDQRMVLDGNPIIVDLKTIEKDITPQKIAEQIAKYKYHMSMAWYIDMDKLLRPDNYAKEAVLFFITKEEPHICVAVELDEPWLEQGRIEYNEGLQTYVECLEAQSYDITHNNIYKIQMPEWVTKKKPTFDTLAESEEEFEDEEEFEPGIQ